MLSRDKKKTVTNQAHTLIADGTEIKGDIMFAGTLHVQGKVIGNIASQSEQGLIIVGESGAVEGEINVPKAIINGRVQGNVHTSDHLELAEKAEVQGNVFYNVIEMLIGARVNGKLVRQDERRNLPAPDQIDLGSADSYADTQNDPAAQ